MNATFATIIHAAPKLDVDELVEVRKSMLTLFEKDFAHECDTNYGLLNPVVSLSIILMCLN